MGSSALVIHGITDAATLEAIACREGLALAQDLLLTDSVIASDSEQVVIDIKTASNGSYGAIISEIRNLLVGFNSPSWAQNRNKEKLVEPRWKPKDDQTLIDCRVLETLQEHWKKISGSSETAAFANARVDWKETPEAHVFKADLPGVKKEEVKVEVEDGNVLVVSGERTKEKEDKNDKWHRVERSSGKFVRRFRLPEDAKVEEVKAGLENGVLTVTVPKAEVKKPQVKAIEISG
ncbi:16.9 kDa class I heat shock protein 1-like [Triticum aestivum]|uniref:16.9 kDa class I heat shock protein 1-like n=1 Tax=Triticum aestivum TaxID=4565 RepID=UPI001D0123F0|nr:16.9 kDa class I heat shock protein 1-like [Triticum aestivum]